MEIKKTNYPVLAAKVDPVFASVIRAEAARDGRTVSNLLKRLLEKVYGKQIAAARADQKAAG